MNKLEVSTNIGKATLKWDNNGKGKVDRSAVRAFSWGHCHSFAYAMHDMTGWPIIGIGYDDTMPGHYVCYCPRIDDFVDIAGPNAFERYDRLVEQGVKQFKPNEYPRSYRAMNREMAEPFVRTVIEKLAKIPDAVSHPNAEKVPNLDLTTANLYGTMK